MGERGGLGPISRRASTILVGLFAGLACIGCPGGSGSGKATRPSVIVVSLDTLRADHLSCYGYGRETSPVLDGFAREALRFEDASSQASGTLPSHLSIFTSLEPTQFRISRDDGLNGDQMHTRLRLPDAVTTVAEVLRDQGYATAAFTDGGFVAGRFGLDQGFEIFDESNGSERGLRRTIQSVAAYLQVRGSDPGAEKPLFLFVHTYDAHAPYRAPAPFGRWFSKASYEDLQRSLGFEPTPENLSLHRSSLTPSDVEEVRALYDNGVRAVDAAMDELFGLLRRSGLYEDSLLIVLSDHGEEFLEHGDFNHGRTVYQELVHVPLLMRLPQGRGGGRVVPAPVPLLDVAPTILDVCGAPVPEQFEGRSLLSWLDAESGAASNARRTLYFESPNVARGVNGLRAGPWKVIHNGRDRETELYDLRSDPGEHDDLAGKSPDVRGALVAELSDRVGNAEAHGKARGWFAIGGAAAGATPASLERLRALGYAQ